MNELRLQPWLPPREPDLSRLAMEVADRLEVADLRAWPEHRKGGIGFWVLPPFLSWHAEENGHHHLVLLQPREVGALVPGARVEPLPNRWLVTLDLENLARPLAHHPAWGGGVASVHVVSVQPKAEGAEVWTRSYGDDAPEIVRAVLDRVSGEKVWSFAD
jgi:hypothetical protein